MGVAFALAPSGHAHITYLIDPTISSLLAAYMLLCGVSLTTGNFRVLIDLPLPRDDQLRIMGILPQQYGGYENIGSIYTRFSGGTRFIELQLYLNGELSLEEMNLGQRIENRLRQHFRDDSFALIPLSEKTSVEEAAYGDENER